jgi:hypothetical protein
MELSDPVPNNRSLTVKVDLAVPSTGVVAGRAVREIVVTQLPRPWSLKA